MLLNPASADRVQSNRKEKCKHEIKKSRPTAKINHCHIVKRSACKIDKETTVPHFDRFQTRRARHLKKRKEHEPDRLTIPCVANQPCLPMVRRVCVVFGIALIRMML